MGAHQQDDIVESAPRVEDTRDFAEDEKPVLNHGGHGPTQRRLKDYHITWIGLCSGIGTGLFIGAGSAYATAGPAGLLLAYIVVGSVLWCVMQSISELATLVISNHPLPQHRWLTLQFLASHGWFISSLGYPLH